MDWVDMHGNSRHVWKAIPNGYFNTLKGAKNHLKGIKNYDRYIIIKTLIND